MGGRLPFLDMFVQRQSSKIVTSVYKKPMFTGLYIHRDSFCPRRYKINLVKILFRWNLLISSTHKLERKLEFASKIFSGNDDPLDVVQSHINAKIAHFCKLNLFGFENVPLYLRLLWISETRARFVRRSPPVLDNCYFSAIPLIMISSRFMIKSVHKESRPNFKGNSVISLFKCQCEAD